MLRILMSILSAGLVLFGIIGLAYADDRLYTNPTLSGLPLSACIDYGAQQGYVCGQKSADNVAEYYCFTQDNSSTMVAQRFRPNVHNERTTVLTSLSQNGKSLVSFKSAVTANILNSVLCRTEIPWDT